ncbi:response regulator [Nakamurella aerolata]|uniref:Response regulator transcription factor n=1 Tax=Nakamurella aerolata TaxID=1656892 RepID=A0A849A962_9ACTN|nr:response regulator transcription factor [Nakamurella aerolata]NNG35020.1 response regulator transcription factor [Nakamurella aerolata]
MTALVTVLAVDDQRLVREGITSLLGLSSTIDVIGEASDGAEALAMVLADRPDVVLLDLRMPKFDGVWFLDRLAERGIAVPCLVLTTFDDDEQVLAAVRADARGYLLKDVSLETVTEAIRVLAAGGLYLHPSATEGLVGALREFPERDAPVRPLPEPLTSRERDVLRLMAAGLTNRQIAQTLFLAEGTVKNHVSQILVKLDSSDRTNAVLRALRRGLLS